MSILKRKRTRIAPCAPNYLVFICFCGTLIALYIGEKEQSPIFHSDITLMVADFESETHHRPLSAFKWNDLNQINPLRICHLSFFSTHSLPISIENLLHTEHFDIRQYGYPLALTKRNHLLTNLVQGNLQ